MTGQKKRHTVGQWHLFLELQVVPYSIFFSGCRLDTLIITHMSALIVCQSVSLNEWLVLLLLQVYRLNEFVTPL